MADGLDRLLDHIVRQYLVRDEVRTIDFDASASEPGVAIEADKREVAHREAERARELSIPFHEGLRRAHVLHEAGRPELILDDRDPAQDEIATALVNALVRTNLATSHTEETEPQHYRYHLVIDWDALHAVAHDAGIDLDRELN